MTLHQTELFQEELQEELEEELLSEFSYSNSFASEPLDLSMRPWFYDSIDYPFRESVSYLYIFYNIFIKQIVTIRRELF